MPKLTIDTESGMAYLKLVEDKKVHHTAAYGNPMQQIVNVDYAEDGTVIGIEFSAYSLNIEVS